MRKHIGGKDPVREAGSAASVDASYHYDSYRRAIELDWEDRRIQ